MDDIQFNIGDAVIIHKPANVNESPTWVDNMNKYDGAICHISKILLSGTRFFMNECGGYTFNIKWIEPFVENDYNFADELDVLSLV